MKLERLSLRHWFNVDEYKFAAETEALDMVARWDVPTRAGYDTLPEDLDQHANILPMDRTHAHAKNHVIPEEYYDYTRMNPVVVLLSLAFSFTALCYAIAGNWTGWGVATLALLPLGWGVLAVSDWLIKCIGGELHVLEHARVFLRLQAFLVFVTLLKTFGLWSLLEFGSLTTPTEFLLANVGANMAFTLGCVLLYGSEKAYKPDDVDKMDWQGRDRKALDKMRFAPRATALRRIVFACVLISPVLAKCVLALGLSVVPKLVSLEYERKRELRLTQRHYRED